MSTGMVLFGLAVFLVVFVLLVAIGPNFEDYLAKRRNKLQLLEVAALIVSIVFLIAELKNSSDLLKTANREATTNNILRIEDSERFVNERLIQDAELLNALFSPGEKGISAEDQAALTRKNKEKIFAFILLHEWQKFYRLCQAGAMQTERWVSVLSLMNKNLGALDSNGFVRSHWTGILKDETEKGFHPGFTEFFQDFANQNDLAKAIEIARGDRWLGRGDGCLNARAWKKFQINYEGYAKALGIDVAAK